MDPFTPASVIDQLLHVNLMSFPVLSAELFEPAPALAEIDSLTDRLKDVLLTSGLDLVFIKNNIGTIMDKTISKATFSQSDIGNSTSTGTSIKSIWTPTESESKTLSNWSIENWTLEQTDSSSTCSADSLKWSSADELPSFGASPPKHRALAHSFSYESSDSCHSGNNRKQVQSRRTKVTTVQRKQPICVFCKNNGQSKETYSSHVLRVNGKVTCPILYRYNCPVCNNNGGDHAHTKTHCALYDPKLHANL